MFILLYFPHLKFVRWYYRACNMSFCGLVSRHPSILIIYLIKIALYMLLRAIITAVVFVHVSLFHHLNYRRKYHNVYIIV